MSIAIDILSSILASGATAAGCTWYAKKTIEHGFATVLADRRSTFETLLEEKRQAFQREVAAQGHSAQAALEGFKSQLTLEAEVRRQVAARRVDVIGKILELADTVKSSAGRPGAYAKVNDLATVLRTNKHLFRADVARAFEGYMAKCIVLDAELRTGDILGAWQRMTAGTEEVIAIARAELRVDDVPSEREATRTPDLLPHGPVLAIGTPSGLLMPDGSKE